jgi:hypothetical protein
MLRDLGVLVVLGEVIATAARVPAGRLDALPATVVKPKFEMSYFDMR